MPAPPSVILVMASEDDGGIARVAAALALGLADAGFPIAVALQRDGRVGAALRERGLPVHLVPELIETLDRTADGRRSLGAVAANLMSAPRGVERLRELARRHRAQLFYSHGSWPNHLAAEATRGWNGPGPGAVWHIHTAFGRTNFAVASRMAARGDVRTIVGVSRSVLGPYAGLGRPCEVIYNGLDLAACAGAAKHPVLRQRLGLPADALVFGYAGRLVAHKGLAVLAAAAKAALHRLPDARFVLLGDNPASAGADVLGALRQDFAAAGLADRAHFPGYQTDPLDWIAGFDLALAPSIYPDPCPLAVIEALALGVPVLGSDIGGISEQIEDGIDGRLLAPGDAEALAQAIVELAGQPDRRAAMARAARAAAAARFDARDMVAKVAGTLTEAAERRP